jgi:hypothetical protein
MRTTLDIDNDILQAAKEIAATRKQTAGQVLSDLARESLTRPAIKRHIVIKDGFPVLESRGGIVTAELVGRLLEEADLEDAGIRPD